MYKALLVSWCFLLLAVPVANAEAPQWHHHFELFLAPLLPAGTANYDYDLQLDKATEEKLLDCPQPTFTFFHKPNPLAGRLALRVTCQDVKQSLVLRVQLNVYTDYYVAAETIKAGTLITKQHLQIKRGNLARLPRDVVLATTTLESWQSRRTLQQGTVLRKNFLAEQRLVRQGDELQLVIEGRGFRVEQAGTALAAGNAGDIIKVRLTTNKIVPARILSTATAQPVN